jgi:carbohydrate-selective porin OprB
VYLFDMSGIGKPFGDMLKSYGIYLNGGFNTNFFGYLGGRKQRTEVQGEYTLGADLDLKTMFGIPGAAIHISTDERTGENPSRFDGSGISSTANYGPTAAYRLGELSYDQDLFNDHVRILVGRIADNIDFAANDQGIYCRFLFSTCGQVNAWYFDNNNPSYPVANWGGRVTIKPTLESYLRFGAYQETTIQASQTHKGWPGESWDFGHNSGVFLPVEIGYKTNFDQDPFPRGFDIGGWFDTAKYTDPFGRPQQDRSALYIQGSQMVFRPDMNAKRGATVFAEALFNTSNSGPIAEEFVAGFTWVGPFAGRPGDQLNFAATAWEWNRSWAEAFFLANGRRLTRNEWQLELNYAYQLAPGIQLQPVVAYIINPDYEFGLFNPALKNSSSSWILGAQLSIGLNGAFGLPSFTRTN